MKKIVWYLLRQVRLAGIVQIWLKSSLTEDGWFKSFQARQPIDAEGKILPWFSYPFIKFLSPRLKTSFTVFEYGAGNSTLWFAERVKQVKSVEHEANWVQKLATKLPAHAKVVHQNIEIPENYANEIAKEGLLYDIVVIDGRERNRCAEACLPYLSPQGVIILDNAERESYLPARQMLAEKGFKCIDFWGMPVGVPYNASTALYYREGNILGV
ncbi:MAG: FkbM family methyltransferase [Bacteroidetes bacterium]|nr:MAG: FkbM family methyltransferase [Bacteroidota bacterium]